MTKLLYYSDSHYTNKGPKSRKDSYKDSIMNKLLQIDSIARKEKVDIILSGGDVTHHANESYDVFMDLYEYHSNTYVKHNIIAGLTHDFMSDFSTGIQKSTLGALWKTGILHVYPQTYDLNLDGVKIHSSHQAICPNEFFGHYTLYRDFKTDANIVLTSHLHMAFGIQEVNGIKFVSPGSIARNSGDKYNFGRVPQIVLVCVDGGKIDKIEIIPLNVSQDIWNEKYLVERDEKNQLGEVRSVEELEGFMSQSAAHSDPSSIISSIGINYSREAVEMALELKGKVENE